MGITQNTGASSLIKPGVIDNAAARPASPYEGQVIFQKDTDQLLVWNGTAWVIPNSPAQNPMGLELVKSQTIGSGVSSVTVTDAFSATYDTYKIILTGGTTNTTDSTLSLRLGSTATGYYLSQPGVNYVGATASFASSNNDAYWLYVGRALTNGNNMNLEVSAPFLANLTYITGAVGNTNTGRNFSGYLNNTTSYTAFTVQVDSATITGGTIRVYGYRNS
jgi:hypothetical protein